MNRILRIDHWSGYNCLCKFAQYCCYVSLNTTKALKSFAYNHPRDVIMIVLQNSCTTEIFSINCIPLPNFSLENWYKSSLRFHSKSRKMHTMIRYYPRDASIQPFQIISFQLCFGTNIEKESWKSIFVLMILL